MKKHLRAFLAGLLLVIPFAVTFYVIWALTSWLGGIGLGLYDFIKSSPGDPYPSRDLGHWGQFIIGLTGAVVTLAAVYLVGLLAGTLLMNRLVRIMERLIQHVPGVKTIYQSIRDLLKLFGSGSRKMGKVVLYRPGGGDMRMLGILTNSDPVGLASVPDHKLVAVYLPLAFMLGGPIIYVPRKDLQELDIPVEHALKICATAETSLSQEAMTPPPAVVEVKSDTARIT